MSASITLDLRRRTFGPHPTSQDWRAATKANIEQALAAEVIRRQPKLYAGHDEDAVKFVRNTMGTTKWDLLLASEAYGLAPRGTYLYPDQRKLQHAKRSKILGIEAGRLEGGEVIRIRKEWVRVVSAAPTMARSVTVGFVADGQTHYTTVDRDQLFAYRPDMQSPMVARRLATDPTEF